MTDIVERLREKRGILDNRWPGPSALELEAADEIERLRKAVLAAAVFKPMPGASARARDR